MSKDTRERLSLRVSPVTSYRLRSAYKKAGCRSMNELAEQAINFYLDYLDAGSAGDFLPTALKSYVDGRLGTLEDRLSSLSFKHSVEVDMMAGILADHFQLSKEDLRQRRANSVNNVKRTKDASLSRSGCGSPGRRTMIHGKTDRQKPLHQVQRQRNHRRLHELHRNAGAGGDYPG